MLFGRVLAFATLALAVPTPTVDFEVEGVAKRHVGSPVDLVARATPGPITQALDNAITILNTAISSSLSDFQTFASNVNGATDATITAVINDLKSVETAITSATQALNSSITNASGGLVGVLLSLTSTEITNIANATTTLANTLAGLQPILTANLTGVTSGLQSSLQAEVAAVQALLSPLLTPLTGLLSTLKTVSIIFTTQPITAAISALQTFLKTLGAQV